VNASAKEREGNSSIVIGHVAGNLSKNGKGGEVLASLRGRSVKNSDTGMEITEMKKQVVAISGLFN